MRVKANLFLLLVLALIVHDTTSWTTQTYCSVVCNKMSCNKGDFTRNGCTVCNPFWMPGGGTCVPNNTNNYYLFNTTADLGGTLVGPSATTTCGAISVYGWMNSGAANIITVSSATGITKSYYQMIVYFGILTTDMGGGKKSSRYWSSATNFYLSFTGGDGFSLLSVPFKLSGTSRVSTSSDYCYSGWRS